MLVSVRSRDEYHLFLLSLSHPERKQISICLHYEENKMIFKKIKYFEIDQRRQPHLAIVQRKLRFSLPHHAITDFISTLIHFRIFNWCCSFWNYAFDDIKKLTVYSLVYLVVTCCDQHQIEFVCCSDRQHHYFFVSCRSDYI